MFVYEKGNSLNLTFKGNIPVENPEVIIKGYKNGAYLTVNGTEVVSVADAVEFENKAKTLVYQNADKLMITFRGFEGMTDPEVVLDETTKGVIDAVVNGTAVTITYTDDNVSVGDSAETDVEETPEVEEDVTDEETETPETEGPTYDLPEFSEEEE